MTVVDMPLARELQRQKRQQIRAARMVMAEMFPRCFTAPGTGAPKRPLKIGIAKDLIAALRAVNSDITGRLARNAIHDYCCGPKYARALAVGGPRYDLNGDEAGAVSAEHARRAADDLLDMEERRKRSSAVERAAHNGVVAGSSPAASTTRL